MSPVRRNPNLRGQALLAQSTEDEPWAVITDALDSALSRGDPEELSALAFVAGEMAATGVPSAAKPILQALQLYTHKKSNASLRDFSMETGALLEVIAADERPRSVLGADVQLAASELAKSLDFDDLAAPLIQSALETYRRHRDTMGSAIAHHALADTLLEQRQGAAAVQEYRKAAERYSRVGDSNGQVACLINAISEALELGDRPGVIRDARKLAVLNPSDPHLRASSLRSQARVLISTGRKHEARTMLLRALRSCRRRFDPDLEVVVLQDLAILTGDVGPKGQSSHWWALANIKCVEYELEHRRLPIAHGLALNQYRCGDLAAAIDTLERALSARTHTPGAVQSLAEADLAAMRLEAELRDPPSGDESDPASRFATISAGLMSALRDFAKDGNAEDAERVLRNFVILCRLSDGGCELFDEALTIVESFPDAGSRNQLMDTLSVAGILCGRVSRIEPAATIDPELEDSRAMSLAEAAVVAHEEWGDAEGALRLFDAAIALLAGIPSLTSYGDILNSRALLLADLEREDEALSSLQEALLASQESENRVLEAMILYNLGEMMLRREDSLSPEYFSRSQALASEVADYEQAVDSCLGAARWFIGAQDYHTAETWIGRASELAQPGHSPAKRAAIMSAEASVAFGRGSFSAAHRLWRDALALAAKPTYSAFALDALAVAGRKEAFLRELRKEVGRWTEPKAQSSFAEGLLRCVHSWSSSDVRVAAQTLAYAQVLSGNGAVGLAGGSNASREYVHSLAVATACVLTFDALAEARVGGEFETAFREELTSIAQDAESVSAVFELMSVLRGRHSEGDGT